MSEDKFDYVKAMAELEGILARVEDPGTSLDDIGAIVRRSKELLGACREYLRSIREEVEKPDSQPGDE